MRNLPRAWYVCGLLGVLGCGSSIAVEPDGASGSATGGTGATGGGGGGGTTSSGTGGGCAAPSVVCGASCVDLESDAAHCGACDHDCQGGSCEGGICQAVAIGEGLKSPQMIAVGGGFVFAVAANQVLRVPTSGGPTEIVATEPAGSLVAAVAADAERVYWVYGGSPPELRYAPVMGGEVVTIDTTTAPPFASSMGANLALGASGIYWSYDAGIGHAALDGSDAGVFLAFPSGTARTLALDDAFVYWTGENAGPGLWRVPVGGGAPVQITADDVGAVGLAVAGGRAYTVDFANSVVSVELSTGQIETVSFAPNSYPRCITTDLEAVYWTEFGLGSVRRASIEGGPLDLLADQQALPVGIAVDATSVYWANAANPGALMKLPKP